MWVQRALGLDTQAPSLSQKGVAWAREAWEAKKNEALVPASTSLSGAVSSYCFRGQGPLWTPSPLSAEITSHLLPRPPRLLLLVNPFGGRGLAWQLCKNHVLPMISEAGLSFNLIQTGKGGARMEGAGLGLNSCILMWGKSLPHLLVSRIRTTEPRSGAGPGTEPERVGRHRHSLGRWAAV